MRRHMRYMKWVLILPLLVGALFASEIVVNTDAGETFVFDVDPDESLGVLQDRISSITDDTAYIVAVPPRKKFWKKKAAKQGGLLEYPRDYYGEVSPQLLKDIRYLVATLANKSLVTITYLKSDLEEIGDRINVIHPLRFLAAIFTDEEMKVGMRNMRGRGWIWNHFLKGTSDCLSSEASIDNVKDEYIIDFAQTVELDVDRIYPSILAHKWAEFVDILIAEIPRKGDHDRYDN